MKGVVEAELRGGGLGSLPVDDGRGAAVVAAAAEGLRPHRLLSLGLRGDFQQMSAGVRHRVDLGSGAALIETEEEEQGEAKAGNVRQSQVRLSKDIWE